MKPMNSANNAGHENRQTRAGSTFMVSSLKTTRCVRPDADEGGVAERQVAGQAEQDVEADGEDAEDRELLQEVRIGRAERSKQSKGAAEPLRKR
jgi:hypothetical protein